MFKFTQLISDRAGIQTQAYALEHYALFTASSSVSAGRCQEKVALELDDQESIRHIREKASQEEESVHAQWSEKAQHVWAQQVVHDSVERDPWTGGCKGRLGSVREGLQAV